MKEVKETKKVSEEKEKIDTKSKNKRMAESTKNPKKVVKNDNLEKVVIEKNKVKKTRFKRYISFELRVFVRILLILGFLFAGIIFTKASLKYNNSKSINYKEQSSVDYKVYLKENNYYDEKYLEKDKIYIASLIDKVNIDFDYNFFIDENVDLDFNYKVIGKLEVQNENGNKTYFEKEYVLKDSITKSINNDKQQDISEKVEVDYGYYNNLANNFKNDFKLNTSSKLTVYLMIDKKGDEYSNLNNNSIMSVEIPLSEQAVNIKLDYKSLNEESKLIKKSHFAVNNLVLMGIGVIFFIILLINLISLFKLISKILPHNGKYKRYVNKILTEYDRVIVNTNVLPNMEEGKIEKIDEFKELLDLRDMLKLPIKYCPLSEEKCYFYLYNVSEDKTYIHVVKKIDMEENKD